MVLASYDAEINEKNRHPLHVSLKNSVTRPFFCGKHASYLASIFNNIGIDHIYQLCSTTKQGQNALGIW